VHAAKDAQTEGDLVLIARVEALIAGAGMDEALLRATAYADAGADVILIHSKADSPREVLEFADAWRSDGRATPLAVLPTTYESATWEELGDGGIKVVIYANQALRAAVRAMDAALATIRQAGTSAPLADELATLAEVFALTRTEEIAANELRFQERVQEAKGPAS
jgi:phosphoenolpyruvate phosphomutase